MDAYLSAIKVEYLKYANLFKQLPNMNYKEMITKENLLLQQQKICNEANALVKNIDWSDKFIIGTVLFHLLVLSSIIRSRKCSFCQILIIISLFVISISGNYINAWGMNNWEKFSNKNYFDKDGSFILFFLNIPILIEVILSMFIIICVSLKSLCCPGSCKTSKKSKKNAKKAKGKQPEEKSKPASSKKAKINKKKIN